jgi:hypothetical protein
MADLLCRIILSRAADVRLSFALWIGICCRTAATKPILSRNENENRDPAERGHGALCPPRYQRDFNRPTTVERLLDIEAIKTPV